MWEAMCQDTEPLQARKGARVVSDAGAAEAIG